MGLVDEEEGEGWLVLREDIFCMRWSSLADMVIWLAVRFSCEEASFWMASSRLSKVDLETCGIWHGNTMKAPML